MSIAEKFNIPPALFETIKRMNAEETEYQEKVKALMKKRGFTSIGQMSPEEKKDFFNTLDAMHKAKHEEVELDEAFPKSTGHALVHSSSGKIVAKGNKAEMQKKMKELNAKEKGSHYVGATNRGKVGDTFGFGSSPADKLSVRNEEVELDEAKSSTGYDLYHKDFSSAMQHAYDFAKKKYNIEIDPTEIDRNVAMGPRKPGSGKANAYRLLDKTGKKAIQVQVANLDNKRYELNMYKEDVDLEEEQKYYSIVHKTTKKVLSTHKNLDSAKDEHRGMDQGVRAHFYIATSTKEPKTFNMKEDVEQIDELSKKTLKNYVKKAEKSYFDNQDHRDIGLAYAKTTKDKTFRKAFRKAAFKNQQVMNKRRAGFDAAHRRMPIRFKEDIDQIDEVKVGDKVSFSHSVAAAGGRSVKKTGTVHQIDGDTVHVKVKDKYGVMTHKKKASDLMKEDVDQIDELKKSTLASYINKAATDAVDTTARGREKTALAKSNFSKMMATKDRVKAKEIEDLVTSQEVAGQKLMTKGAKRLTGVGIASRKLAKEEVELEEDVKSAAEKIETYAKTLSTGDMDKKDFMKVASMLKRNKVKEAVKFAMNLDSDPRDYVLTTLENNKVNFREEIELTEKGPGLWANIRAKRARGEKMRKPGEKGAPTEDQIRSAKNEEFEDVNESQFKPGYEFKAPGYDQRVQELENKGMSTSDAQGVADTEVRSGKHKNWKQSSKKKMKEEIELTESDFKIGDDVICKDSGMEGEVVKIDEPQTGKYYTVKREDGKMVKYAPDELKAEDEEEMKESDASYAAGKEKEKENKLTPSDKDKLAKIRAMMGKEKKPMKEEIEELDEVSKHEKYLRQHIDQMRTQYSKIDKIDPASDNYKDLIRMLDALDLKTLQTLAGAKIKFVSGLAQNRVVRKMNEEVEELDEISADVAKRVAQKRDQDLRKGTSTATQKRRMGRGDWRADPQLHADKARQSAEKRGAKDVYDYNKKEEVEFDEASNPQMSMKRAGLSVERAKEVVRHQKQIGTIRKKREALRNSYDPAIIEAYKKMKKKNEVTKDDNKIIKSSDKLSGKQEPIELEPELKEQKR